MATFYLLPPRPFLGACLAERMRAWFPGPEWGPETASGLAERLLTVLAEQPDVYVVHREDLQPGEEAAQALRDGFGAEAGDEIVEVRAAQAGALAARRWRLE